MRSSVVGQVGPCPCGEPARFIDCHIPQFLELPCLCKSGEVLGNCCALSPARVDRLLAEHPELHELAGADL